MRKSVMTAFVLCVTAAWLAVALTASTAAPGRYKKDGSKCVWVANETGPDQCQPPAGRYKQDGDKCVWDAGDDGPDQCRPKGRFKKDGTRCVWDANDAGPDQCRPAPQPR